MPINKKPSKRLREFEADKEGAKIRALYSQVKFRQGTEPDLWEKLSLSEVRQAIEAYPDIKRFIDEARQAGFSFNRPKLRWRKPERSAVPRADNESAEQ